MHSVTYRNPDGELLLDNVTLALPYAQIGALVGDVHEAGDAVMAILSGVCTKYKGRVSHHGMTADPGTLAQTVAVCPMEHFLMHSTSVRQNVELFLRQRHTVGKWASFCE